MTRFGFLSAALLVAVGISVSISAQSGPARSEPAVEAVRAGDRRDAVEAEPVELALVAAHARQPGLQPARSDRSHQRRQAEDGVGARHGQRQHGIDAARLRRRDVRAGAGRLHPGDQRQDRRPDLGEPAQAARRRPRRHQPQHRHLGHDDHRRQRRQPDVRHRRQDRSPGVGNEGARRDRARVGELGPDHRQRQGDRGPPVPAAGRQRRLHRHRARRQDRQGAVAHAHDSAARRARLRHVGRRADGRALARRHVDGAELRPRDQHRSSSARR